MANHGTGIQYDIFFKYVTDFFNLTDKNFIGCKFHVQDITFKI